MSRHTFETNYKGEKIQVVAGWDRPLQGFFMTIEKITASDNDADNFILDNIIEENPYPQSFAPFIRVLTELNIAIPAQMIDEIIADSTANIGNKDVLHCLNGGIYERRI